VVVVAATAAIIGDNIGYVIGRLIGLRLIVRYGRYIRLDETRLKVGQYLFLRHGGKIVFFGRFVAFLRTFAAVLAGVNRMPWSRFLIMNALGGICWASLFGGGAYWFGEKIKLAAGPISWLLLIIAIGLVAAGILFFRRHEPWNGTSPVREELFSVERLERHAESLAAAQQVTTRPPLVRSLQARLSDNAAALLAAYRICASDLESGRGVVPAAEWLLDNYHLVEEQIREIRADLPPGLRASSLVT
jgi:membrane protein YqaA with SNARE-associated domain